MKIAIVGYGGMGQAVDQCAKERGHSVSGIIQSADIISDKSTSGMDMVIECAVPTGIKDRIEALCALKKDIVVVTTGWYRNKEEIRKMVKASGNRFMYSPNFSIGVNLFYRIVDYTASLMNHVDNYDVWATELHHKMKMDSPSGTAKKLTEIILNNIDRKSEVVEDALQRKIKPSEFHFSSTRGGMVNFSHTIGFDSAEDCIEIKHSARSRKGYAEGVIACSEWLVNQSPGFYSMEDYLESILSE